MIGAKCVCIVPLVVAFTLAGEGFEPPSWKSGSLPQAPQRTSAWGQVLLEVSVSEKGEVEQTVVLRSTPPFTDRMKEAVGDWLFEPATMGAVPSPARVLVGALFRPPMMLNAPSIGEPPRDVAVPSESVPFPTSVTAPLYPSRAQGDGVVLVEATVGPDGSVGAVAVLRSAPGFDANAVQAALLWRFRAARRDAAPISTKAFLVFAFRQPVLSKPHRG